MILKKYKDFLIESNSKIYYGYLNKDIIQNLKTGDKLIHTYIKKSNGEDLEIIKDRITTFINSDDEGFTIVDKDLSDSQIKDLINNNDLLSSNYYYDDHYFIEFSDIKKDSNGVYFKDTIHGGRSYFKYKDDNKNNDHIKTINKFNLYEALGLKGDNNLEYLLKQLKDLIHDNDSYKAIAEKKGNKIIIKHEDSNKSQKIIIKENDNSNDFFVMTGVDKSGKKMDDMGEQPYDTIIIKIAQYFQE